MAQSSLFFLELLTCLMKLARGADLPLEEVFGADFTGAVRAADFASAEELGAWCLERCLRMQSQIRRQRTDTAGKTVEMAKEYIHSHYGESDLSVEKICEYLHLSAGVFFHPLQAGDRLDLHGLRDGGAVGTRPRSGCATPRTRPTSLPRPADTRIPTTSLCVQTSFRRDPDPVPGGMRSRERRCP